MPPLTAAMLRRYSGQVEQQIDEYADRLEDLVDWLSASTDQVPRAES